MGVGTWIPKTWVFENAIWVEFNQMCPKIGNKIEEKSFWNDDSWYYYPKMLILCPYSITTWKEIEHLDKNTFAFFMELLWKELWCLHFSKICSNEMADTGHYLNWVTQSFTTLMEDFSQDNNRDSSFSDYNNVNGMIFDPPLWAVLHYFGDFWFAHFV